MLFSISCTQFIIVNILSEHFKEKKNPNTSHMKRTEIIVTTYFLLDSWNNRIFSLFKLKVSNLKEGGLLNFLSKKPMLSGQICHCKVHPGTCSHFLYSLYYQATAAEITLYSQFPGLGCAGPSTGETKDIRHRRRKVAESYIAKIELESTFRYGMVNITTESSAGSQRMPPLNKV